MNFYLARGPVTFGDVVYSPEGAFGPRVQRDFQMVILHSGSLALRVDRDRITPAPGTAVLLSPGHLENFRFARETESRHSWCAIQVAAVPAALQKQFREARGPAPFAGAMASLHELALGGTREEEGNEYLENRYALHLGLAMFCDFALAVQAGGAEPRRRRRDRARDEIYLP